MNQRLLTMLASLRDREWFEDAASDCMRTAMDVAAAALAESAPSDGARVRRAMVHHRPASGYRRLAVKDAESTGLTLAGLEEAFLPSATALRWIVENRQPASIDVNLALIQTETPGGPEPATDDGLLSRGETSQETRMRLLRRGATHVYVLPLRGLRGAIDGLVSIEAHCPAAIGRPIVWSACAKELELVVALAAPFILDLPQRPSTEPATDPHLPVAGEAMTGLVRLLRVFREQRETLLISGPTGSGKSRLARWCHMTSNRSAGPFEVLDLSTVPEDLQIGELFGWKKGAFTGASRDNPGALGRAEGGTLFIDEIDKLSLRAQAGLLHVLEERAYRALGDSAGERAANVRFIAGTNVDLLAAVRDKRLREDLFYRINVLPVELPALADRRDEIAPWAAYMVERCHSETARDGRASITEAGVALLARQPWPGNLRQLDNIVRRAYALAVAELGGIPPRALAVEEAHLARALAYEARHDDANLLPSMHAAAVEFYAEAKRRFAKGGALDLDLAEGFKGFVLAAALEDEGDPERVFSLFGKELLVKCRNHRKVIRREIERADALCRVLPGGDRARLARLANDGEGATGASKD